METIAVAAPFIAMAAGGAQIGLGILGGMQQAESAKLERKQYEEEASAARLAADQEEVTRLKRLQMALATNEAIRGASGLSLQSGSADAIAAENVREAERDIATARYNQLARARRAEFGAYGAALRETGGILSGAGGVVSGLSTIAGAGMRMIPTGGKTIGKG
jgi:hypothetical protein